MKNASTVLLLICFGGFGCAEPPALPANAPVFIKVVNLEQVNLANSLEVPGYRGATGLQGAWGLLNVLTLENGVVTNPNVDIGAGGSIFFHDDGAGGTHGQITGIVYGIQNTSDMTSTGGTIDLFWRAPGATYIAGSCTSGSTCQPNATTVEPFISGTFLARLQLASGIDPASSQTFTRRNAPVTSGTAIQSASFANVDTTRVGAWTSRLDGNWFTTSFGPRDIRLTMFSVPLASWSTPPATIGLRGNDPIRVFTH